MKCAAQVEMQINSRRPNRRSHQHPNALRIVTIAQYEVVSTNPVQRCQTFPWKKLVLWAILYRQIVMWAILCHELVVRRISFEYARMPLQSLSGDLYARDAWPLCVHDRLGGGRHSSTQPDPEYFLRFRTGVHYGSCIIERSV